MLRECLLPREYRAAVTTLAEARALRGPPAATPWDPALVVALPEGGVWVEEETVLNDLLTDLGTRSRWGASPGGSGRGGPRIPTDPASSRASSCTTSPGIGTRPSSRPRTVTLTFRRVRYLSSQGDGR
ncbi:DUF2399 domain-containing protein [Streptomyces flaveolus]|uniref:DUF2399 domain-containing protein n=1 Tax=Streptomyces flaveolus TaxID=67297 RepID=UPI0036F59A43